MSYTIIFHLSYYRMYVRQRKMIMYAGTTFNWQLFSSPKLKAQVSFSKCLLSVCLSVCLSVHWSCVNFSHFHLPRYPEPLGQFKLNFISTKHLWVKRTQVSSNEGSCSFPREGNNKITLTKLKMLLLMPQCIIGLFYTNQDHSILKREIMYFSLLI